MSKTKKLDLDRIEQLVEKIGAIKPNANVTDLMNQLKQEDGMKHRFSAGTYHVNMAGIRSTSTEGERGALRNWAQRARRELKGRR